MRWIAMLCVVACQFDPPPKLPPRVQDIQVGAQSAPEIAVVEIIADGMAGVALTKDQQQKLRELDDDLMKKHEQVRSLRVTLAIDIASSVSAGNVDEAGLLTDAKVLGTARADAQPDDAKAFQTLHATLDAAQRAQFAIALIAKADKVKADDLLSRYSLWKSDLGTSNDQDNRIEPALRADTDSEKSAQAERDDRQKRMRDTANAFKGDTFKGEVLIDPNAEKVTIERIKRVIAFMKIVLPELTPEQRMRAATIIRSGVGVAQGSVSQ